MTTYLDYSVAPTVQAYYCDETLLMLSLQLYVESAHNISHDMESYLYNFFDDGDFMLNNNSDDFLVIINDIVAKCVEETIEFYKRVEPYYRLILSGYLTDVDIDEYYITVEIKYYYESSDSILLLLMLEN